MTIPQLKFEVAFGVPPQTTVDAIGENPWLIGVTGFSEVGETTRVGYSGDWTDLSSRLRASPGVSWSYGRRSELDRMEAGIGSVLLENSDRALDPTNEAGPYWPYIRPMVRCRLTVINGSDRFSVFVGFIEGWSPLWPGQTDSVVEVPVVDGFTFLASARTSVGYPLAASGTRVGDLLDAAGWNADDRDLDAGQSDVQAYTAEDRVVLSAIQETSDTEDGVFYITPAGVAQFRDRSDRIVSDSLATFGDGPGELPYRDLIPAFNYDHLWNDVSAEPVGLAVQRAESVSSQAAYGTRWLAKNTIHTSEFEAADFVNWLLGRYSQPRLRVEQIVLMAHGNPDVLTQVLARTPGDRVKVIRRPPGGGDPIELEVFIESVSHNISGAEWITTWSLSPVQANASWRWGVPGSSELNVSTRLSY